MPANPATRSGCRRSTKLLAELLARVLGLDVREPTGYGDRSASSQALAPSRSVSRARAPALVQRRHPLHRHRYREPPTPSGLLVADVDPTPSTPRPGLGDASNASDHAYPQPASSSNRPFALGVPRRRWSASPIRRHAPETTRRGQALAAEADAAEERTRRPRQHNPRIRPRPAPSSANTHLAMNASSNCAASSINSVLADQPRTARSDCGTDRNSDPFDKVSRPSSHPQPGPPTAATSSASDRLGKQPPRRILGRRDEQHPVISSNADAARPRPATALARLPRRRDHGHALDECHRLGLPSPSAAARSPPRTPPAADRGPGQPSPPPLSCQWHR